MLHILFYFHYYIYLTLFNFFKLVICIWSPLMYNGIKISKSKDIKE